MEHKESWKTIISSSTLMSLALLGDALIYAILPVYAENFGLTIPMVGILLAANRIVRIFIYTLISKLVTSFGARVLCIIAAVMATLSTCLYGISDGFFPPAWSVLPLVSFGIINNSSQVFYNFPRFWFAKEVVRFTKLRMF